jgi:hypothetical protein
MDDKVRVLVAQGDYVETLWAKPLGDDLFQIDNIPFGLRGLSLGDIVKCRRNDNMLELDGVQQKSGARTLQISVEAGTQSAIGQQIAEQLRKLDLPFETYERVFGVAVPPASSLEDLMLEMEMLRAQGVDYTQLDPNADVEVPIVPGSPAEKQREDARQKAWADLEAFAKGEK